MKQVFFKTVQAVEPSATTAGDARFADLEKGKLGFWDLSPATGGDWFASALFQTTNLAALPAISATNFPDDTAASIGDATDLEAVADQRRLDGAAHETVANPLFLKSRFQIAQGFSSGNPLVSPIISASDIVRVDASGHTATTQYAVTYTPDTGAEGDGDELELKFVIRQGSTQYLDFVNNEAAFADLSDGTHRFPLSGFHNNNHKIINISCKASSTATLTCDNVRAAVKNHGVLNAMIKTSGTATAILTARHPGVVFEIIGFNLTDDAAFTSTDFGITNFVPGVGNAWQARTEELKARALQGDYNRMYFPMSQTDFVTDASTDYDRYEIVYKINGDWGPVKGSMYGSAVIYEVDGQNDVGAVLNAGTADPGSAKTEYIWGKSH